MINVTGRVTRSGQMNKKNGDVVVNKDGDSVLCLEIGGRSGLFTFASSDFTTDSLPRVGIRVTAQVVRENWKIKEGEYGERMVTKDWQEI